MYQNNIRKHRIHFQNSLKTKASKFTTIIKIKLEMTRTINKSAHQDSTEKKNALLKLMDSRKISLFEASKLLDIPYETAK